MHPFNDLAAIRAFVAVADAGSFSRAAEKTGLTRSAVGKAVARLEEQLGTRLLQRSTRRVGLTVEGQSFHERWAQILADVDEAEASLRQGRIEPAGILRLTVPGAFGRLRVLPVLHRYLLAWPQLRAEVSFTDRLSDIVEDGFDLAVRIGRMPSTTSYITRVLARTTPILCAAPAYIDRYPAPASIDDLGEHRRLAFGDHRRPLPWHLRDTDGRAITIDGPPQLLFDSAEALREAALLGHGIVYMPDFLVAEDIRAGRLVPVLPDTQTEALPILAIYPTRQHLSNKVRLFLDMLADELSTGNGTPEATPAPQSRTGRPSRAGRLSVLQGPLPSEADV